VSNYTDYDARSSRIEPDDQGGDDDQCPIVGDPLWTAGCQAAPLLETVNAALDPVALLGMRKSPCWSMPQFCPQHGRRSTIPGDSQWTR